MANIDVDTKDFDAKIVEFNKSTQDKLKKAINDVANEVLRLSQREVPHDTGQLQNSGAVEPGQEQFEAIVGYNKVYAAYQHEGVRADGTHIITHWQGGRKGKYLEDPIRNNVDNFKHYFEGIFDQ